ncbi:GAF domain-containing protein [Cytobacillus horneckiae]|uniref:GAF domain-containing protein n=1 Tax=Cytobacillus horneckiae TaxID=549687 RepID=UPI003D9AB1B3
MGFKKEWETSLFEEHCLNLFPKLSSDFIGLALQNDDGPDVSWRYAAGNQNEKYKRISVRYGKGIAGKVISTGRPMTIMDFPHHITGRALQYPIMLAENLRYAFAVPIHINEMPKGVFLIGNRTEKPVAEMDKDIIQKAAHMLERELGSSNKKSV